METKLYSEEKIESKEVVSKKEISLKNVDEKIMTIDDFLDDFNIDSQDKK